MRELLDRGVKMEALVAANDLMALGALEVLQSKGYRVPDDIGLAGFDDVDEARLAIPQLTTVRQPFHILGREAVRVALAQIRGEPVADVTPIASQVVIRRSCGCRSNAWDETELPPGSILPEAGRSEIEARFLVGFATLAGEGITVSEASALKMFDAVFEELDGKSSGRFAGMLADVIRATATEGLTPWHRVISVIFRTLHGWTSTDAERRGRLESIRKQVRAYIGDIAELAQGQQRVRLQRLTLDMSEAAKALTGTVNLGGINDALLQHLPRLHVPACTMSLYVDASAPHHASRLELAYDSKRPEISSRVGEVFETKHLAPPGLLFSDARETVILEPLFFEHDQLGIINLTMGPEDGVVYEAIRDQVSGAIRGAWLVSRVVEEVKRRQALEKEQADNEMRIAANIQTMILPQKYQIPNLDVFATMVPAVNVGGDYYDIHPTSDGCWLGIGDVVGHGLRSGLIMLMLQSTVSGLIKGNPLATPKDVICTANAVLYENIRTRLKHDEHMTLCLLRITQDGRVRFAGAHEEILVYRANSGRCERVLTEGIWSGIVPDMTGVAKNQELQLMRGDLLVLYTDGLVEARDIRGRFYTLERFVSEVERVGELPVAQICSQLIDAVRSWMSSQQDDLTLVVARYSGQG